MATGAVSGLTAGSRADDQWSNKECILLAELAVHDTVFTHGNYEENTPCSEWQDWNGVSTWFQEQVAFRRKAHVVQKLFSPRNCKESWTKLISQYGRGGRLPTRRKDLLQASDKLLVELRRRRMGELQQYNQKYQQELDQHQQVIQLCQQGKYDSQLKKEAQRLRQQARSNTNTPTPGSRPPSTTPGSQQRQTEQALQSSLAKIRGMSRSDLLQYDQRISEQMARQQQDGQKKWAELLAHQKQQETMAIQKMRMQLQQAQRSYTPQQFTEFQRKMQASLQQIRTQFTHQQETMKRKIQQNLQALTAMSKEVKACLTGQ